VTPLRQLTRQTADADAYLFKPQAAMRLRPRPFEGTPLPPDEPAGQNPANGAIIDYILKAEPAGDIRIEILDAKGRPIRQYSSADRPPPPRPAPVVTSNWLPHPLVLTKKAGMNRFVWDLRYGVAPVATLGGGGAFLTPRGLMVLPGDYQVRLTVKGQRYTQPLKVELDPRVKTPLADLERQFTFEQQVIGAMSNARNLNTAIRDLQAKLGALDKSLGAKADENLAGQVKALEARLSDFFGASRAEDQGEVRGRPGLAGRARGTSPQSANVSHVLTLLTQALSAADGADAAPTEACLTAAHQAQEMLGTARERWDSIKRRDVKALNEALAKQGREEIDVMEDL